MVEIREVDGRFEVYAPGVHWEAFTDRDRAETVAAEVAAAVRLDPSLGSESVSDQ